MSAPRWARGLLRRLAPEAREEEVLGDLEEAYRAHVNARGRLVGGLLSALGTLDMASALLRERGIGTGLSWLDVKLGLRMLVRYPGLTALGGLAIAFAIFAGAGTFEFLSQVVDPSLPFEGGDRMVGIQLWNAREGDDHGQALFDYGVWQEELTTVEELGAYDSVVRNLIVAEGDARLVTGAAMDAAGFRITGIEPLLGRTLVEEDERPGSPLPVVLGHDLWRNVFGSDPDVLGRVVRVGTEPATVVGVMPEGFTFPVAHQLWLPMRLDPGATEPGEGPTISVFGRLAPGVSMDEAQAQLGRIGERLASAHPATHEHLRVSVKPYARAALGLPASISDRLVSAVAMSYNIPLVLFLVLVCGNVALLMFARAAAREGELVVRTALGAGRRRIVGQLFVEALVLAAVGAAAGLSVAEYGLRWGYHIVELELWEGPLPFWLHPDLSLRTVVYVLLLTLVGATVAGMTPALKVTRGLATRLREASSGGGGLRFGGLWTFVIVSQVAVTVVFPAVTLAVALEGREIETFDPGIPAHEYLTARLAVQPGGEPGVQPGDSDGADSEEARAAFEARSRTTLGELEEKLLADSRVTGVTFAERAPRVYAGWNQIEVDGPTAPPQDERGHRMGRVAVETDFFETLGVEPRAGRDFHPADAEAGSRVVIVNEAFLDYVLGGRNAIGVHFRYVASEGNPSPDQEPEPWFRIVGVVQDLGSMSGYSSAVVYHPVPDRSMNPVYAIVHVRGDASAFTSGFRAAAFDVDPTLRILDPVRLDRVVDSEVQFYRFWIWTLIMGTSVAVVLSLGGIYSAMSFTVARRTREIGVRVALGAPRTSIALAVFRRPLLQLALGLLTGGLVSAFLMGVIRFDVSARDIGGFLLHIAVMTAVCLLACIVPTRRALAVEPSEALRAE